MNVKDPPCFTYSVHSLQGPACGEKNTELQDRTEDQALSMLSHSNGMCFYSYKTQQLEIDTQTVDTDNNCKGGNIMFYREIFATTGAICLVQPRMVPKASTHRLCFTYL